MRMPNSEEMSDEQRDIYQHAPVDGAILIAGPPGTGKTVIAFLRADNLSASKKTTVMIAHFLIKRSILLSIIFCLPPYAKYKPDSAKIGVK